MTQITSRRGSGRKISLAQNLNKQQEKLGLGKSNQCLPSLERNTGIEPNETSIPSLHAAVLMRIQQIYFQKFISEEMVAEAKATADLIEKRGFQMLYGKEFLKTARAMAILSFQKDGYKAFGLFFKSELNNEIQL
jgi:hypothetical protein